MDRTIGAGRLGFLERTFCQPQLCIGHEHFAVGTERALRSMAVMAIDIDHDPDGFFFTDQTQMFFGHDSYGIILAEL